MLNDIIYHLEVFLFVMAILIVCANIWNIITVFRLESGRMFSSRYDLFLLGGCVSYIITMLVIGF
jgi:hypothetical protein